MAFTQNQVQGVFGEFKGVLDDAVVGGNFSQNNVQGIFGEFDAALDDAAAVTGIASLRQLMAHGQGTRV